MNWGPEKRLRKARCGHVSPSQLSFRNTVTLPSNSTVYTCEATVRLNAHGLSHTGCSETLLVAFLVTCHLLRRTYLVSLWLFIAVRNSWTIAGLWFLHGVFDMYFNV